MQMLFWPNLGGLWGSMCFNCISQGYLQHYCPTVFLKNTSNCFAWLAALASSLSSVVRRAEAAEVVGLAGIEPRAAETRLGLR